MEKPLIPTLLVANTHSYIHKPSASVVNVPYKVSVNEFLVEFRSYSQNMSWVTKG